MTVFHIQEDTEEADHLAEASVQFGARPTPLLIQNLPKHPPLSTREREILWMIARGCSEQSMQNHLRLSAGEMEGQVSSIEDKLGTSRLGEAAALIEAAGSTLVDSRSQDLVDNELSTLIGARVLFPIFEQGFAGLRLAMPDGTRLNFWLTSNEDNEVPGWAYLEAPDDPGVLALDDLEVLRSRIAQARTAKSAQALRRVLEDIAQEALDWLDRIDGDADCEVDAESEAEMDQDIVPTSLGHDLAAARRL